MQQEQIQEQQLLHQNCTFVCITEDVNYTGKMEVTTLDSDTTTLAAAKEWIEENRSRGHYSCQNYEKIIVIDSNGAIEQIYTNQPEEYDEWYSWY